MKGKWFGHGRKEKKGSYPDCWSCGMWAVEDKDNEEGSKTGSEGQKMKQGHYRSLRGVFGLYGEHHHARHRAKHLTRLEQILGF